MTDNEIKSTGKSGMRTVNIRAETWHALLEIAGRQIDPETAEVCSSYGQIIDPYGVCSELHAEQDCVGRLYFARNPESEVWIEFGDLPDATRNALENRRPDRITPTPTDYDIPF